MKHIFTSFTVLVLLLSCPKVWGQVTVTSSDSLSCLVHCTTLHAHVIGDIPFNPHITLDDHYTPTTLPLGFNFNFYGVNYYSCLMGDNGNITFDTTLVGGTDPYPISAAFLGNTEQLNCIAGPWCDVYIPEGGTITYSSFGTAPNRRFCATWCHCQMYTTGFCPGQYLTTQIILYETTNIIEVHISNKTICTSWNGGHAECGVQNATGTVATVAPARDMTPNWTGIDEGWRFTPISGGTNYTVASIPYAPIPYDTSTVYWYNFNTGAYLGTGDSIVVCPTVATTYRAGALGCTDTSFGYYTVTPAGTLTIIATVTNPTQCALNDGYITINGLTTGMIDTLNYDLGGVPQPQIIATVSSFGSLVIPNLCAGVYSNIVVKQGLCVSPPAGPETLVNTGISISGLTSTNPTKCGLNDGSITINGLYPLGTFIITYDEGGIAMPPITLTSNSSGSLTLTGLDGTPSVIYSNIVATYTGICGTCTTPAVGPITLTAPPGPDFYLIGSTNPTQCGYCDGTIKLYGMPPFTMDTIKYELNGISQPPVWTTVLGDSSIILGGLCAGNYTNFTITIGKCVSTIMGNTTLVGAAVIPGFSKLIHYGCKGDTVYFFNSSTSVGTVLNYVWNFDDGSPLDTATNPWHIFAQGTYTVTLVATNHYCFDTATDTFTLYHPIHAGFTTNPELLCQKNLVNFTDTSTGFGLSYAWSFGNGVTANTDNASYFYKNTGQYKVQLIVTDFVPCHDTAVQLVQVDSLSPLSILLTDSVFCRSTYSTFTGIYTTIGLNSVTWNFGDGDVITNQNPVSHAFDAVGVFTVTVSTDYRVCRDTNASRVVVVFPVPNINLGNDTTICAGSQPLILTDKTNAETAGASWKWNTGQTSSSIVVTEAGTYSAKVTIDGCSQSYTVIVDNDCYMDIPNVFTPNGDGLNDFFFPRTLLTAGLTSFNMNIYNRWGELVYQSTTLDGRGWDGKLNNTDQPEGVYVYVIDATFKDGQHEHRQGNITLLR